MLYGFEFKNVIINQFVFWYAYEKLKNMSSSVFEYLIMGRKCGLIFYSALCCLYE